ncbi:MAG: ATP-binding protein [Pseudomonadota bacterium]
MARAAKNRNGNTSTTTPSNVRRLAPLAEVVDPAEAFLTEIEPERTLRDIVLNDPTSTIVNGLIDELKASETLRRHNVPLRSRILLCGPPGNGKTLLAEVLAQELMMPLYTLRLDTIVSSYLGETASNLRKAFDFAIRRPCVLFLDEFDALGRTRTDDADHSEMRRVVNSVLQLMNHNHSRSYFVAATNIHGTIDDALWRRFDEVIEMATPDQSAIEQLLNIQFKNFRTSFKVEKRAVDFINFSFAEVERVCYGAIKLHLIKKTKSVTAKQFEHSVQDELRRRKLRTPS